MVRNVSTFELDLSFRVIVVDCFTRLQISHDHQISSIYREGLPVLAVDMDEMMAHCFKKKQLEKLSIDQFDESQVLRFTAQGESFTCVKRPNVDEFLKKMSKHYILIPWTAGTQEYATPILDWLDPDGSLFKFRLFRQHCTEHDGGYYVKDLNALNVPLHRILLLDNNPRSYEYQPENGVPIVDFEGDSLDTEFVRCDRYTDLLIEASKLPDMRRGITQDLRLMIEKQRIEIVSVGPWSCVVHL